MTFRQVAGAAAVVVFATASGVCAATAQDDVCTGLEAELASLEQGPGAGSKDNFRQYDVAVARQRGELDRATAEAQRAGCMGGFLIFQPKPSAKCAPLMATIARMKANLQRLTASRDQFATDPFQRSQRRSQVLNALAAHRCGNNYTVAGAPPPPRSGNFFDMLFGDARQRSWDDQYYGPGGQFGTYRTLCVRKCDGYYFPISFSTVPSRFGGDEQTCQSMCPGSDVALYIYRNPGQDANQMVSLAGEPYTALPTAFRYRQEYDAACTCGAPLATAMTPLSAPAELTGPAAMSPVPGAPAAILPKPLPRPAAGEDPETLANRAGDFVPKPVAAKSAGDAVAGISDGTRSVRIVGPNYYYGQ
jgi:hypothetical protein